jgi:dihydroorotate dehydrogenase (NAD+) catalytic subunit
MVDKVYTNCSAPIIAIGGISTAADAIEFILCGATAFQVGTALFIEPNAPVTIAKGLRDYLRRKGLKSLDELRGKVRKY